MCRRFTLTAEAKQLAKRFGVEISASFYKTVSPRYNIAPTQPVVVVGDAGNRYLTQMRWGLIPPWAKAEPLERRDVAQPFRRKSWEPKAELKGISASTNRASLP